MKKIFLLLSVFGCMSLASCRDDETYKQEEPAPSGSGKIELALTGRVGTVVDQVLTGYVKSLNLFLFRENGSGDYTLFRNVTLNKAQLQALENENETAAAGYTVYKRLTFDSVPLATYRIVGVGNILDSLGNPQSNVSLRGVNIGNGITQVLASVLEGDQPSRLFWGITGAIRVGTTETNPPVLSLVRKISMFALTLEKIPDVVNRIDMEFHNTYGAFNMNGDFLANSGIVTFASNAYQQEKQDSITLTYISLPTVEGDSTTFQATFYLVDGPKQVVQLPKYVLKPNTITKVTATIDPDQASDTWKVNLNTLITVNVEWNVDQEPPITI